MQQQAELERLNHRLERVCAIMNAADFEDKPEEQQEHLLNIGDQLTTQIALLEASNTFIEALKAKHKS